jgi:hypothetical protein
MRRVWQRPTPAGTPAMGWQAGQLGGADLFERLAAGR